MPNYFVRQLLIWEESLEGLLERASDMVGHRRYVPYLILAAFSIAYFLLTCYRASRKLFWFDELFTLPLSRLPDPKSLWNALLNGVDFNPPLIYPLTQLSERLFGIGHVSLRLPAIIGFWVFCLCMFRFVVTRSSVLGALVSALFPMVTMAYWYAYEARPHALVLGFCGIALVCWQAAAERTHGRFWWLLGLGTALALALLSHSYAYLIFVPLVCGELWRTVVRHRPDWPVWGTIALSSTAILVSLPLLHAAKSNLLVPDFNLPSIHTLVRSYQSILGPAGAVLIGALTLLFLASLRGSTAKGEPNRNPRAHEIVALLTFVTIPVVAYLVAKFTGAPLLPRYSITVVAGIAGLLGLAAGSRPTAAVGILILLGADVGMSAYLFRRSVTLAEPTVNYPISTVLSVFRERYEWMKASPDKHLPIVLLNYHDFMPTLYYAPSDLLSRLVYVMWSMPDVNGENYARLQDCCHLPFACPVHRSEFLESNEKFLAFGMTNDTPWLANFIRHGATVALENVSPEYFLALVMFPKKSVQAGLHGEIAQKEGVQ